MNITHEYTREMIADLVGNKQPTDPACIDNLVSRLLETDPGPIAPKSLVRLLIGAWYDGLRHERVRAAAQNRNGNETPTWADVQGVFGDMDVGLYSLDDLYRIVGTFSGLYMHSLTREHKAEAERDATKALLTRMVTKLRDTAKDTDGVYEDVADIYDEGCIALGLKPSVKDPTP